jgi:tetratricopeptide (TPR) repeat protein
LGYGFLAPKDAAPKAKAAALKALQIDSSLAEPHASLGYIKLYYDWDFPGAEQEFKKAISLNPNYEVAYDWYGLYLTAMGRNEDARKIIEKAAQIDPLSAVISTDMGFNLYYGKNFDKAVQSLKSTIELNPRFLAAHLWLGRTYQAMKKYDEALEEYQVAQTIFPNWVPIVAGMGNIYGIAGQKAEAEKTLDSLHQMSSKKYVTPYGVALVYAGLGETDKVFEYLEKAYDDRSNWLIWLNLDPRWDSVRSDKRFIELVRKVGLSS